MTVGALHWTTDVGPGLPGRFAVQIRYRHRAVPAQVERAGPGAITVRFDEPQRAVTPGQFGVLYREDEMLGGGVILEQEGR